MTSKQKIAKVLKQIKEDSEINPNSKWVEFKLNTGFVASGVLMADEEGRILLKLEKGGVIKLHLPKGKGEKLNSILSQYTPSEFMYKNNFIWIEILTPFYIKYIFYKIFYLKSFNIFYLTNPLWWLWKFFYFIYFLIKKLVKSKIVSIVLTILVFILTHLAIDYPLVWINLKKIYELITKYL